MRAKKAYRSQGPCVHSLPRQGQGVKSADLSGAGERAVYFVDNFREISPWGIGVRPGSAERVFPYRGNVSPRGV
jgi:hypothetical protein